MPNTKWSELNKLQLGRYAEYYAKMEFASYGFEVYTTEVDDHGVDFIAKAPKGHNFYEVQVKSCRDLTYIFIPKSKMELTSNRIVCILLFSDDCLPDVYIIPATAWLVENDLFKSKDYKDLKSSPEWGLNLSKKNLPLLKPYKIENILAEGKLQ
jgi:hypothetical protein